VGVQGGRPYQKQKVGRRIEQTRERGMGGRCRWCRQLATFAICPEETRLNDAHHRSPLTADVPWQGVQRPWAQRDLTIAWLNLPSGPVTASPTGRHPSLIASLTLASNAATSSSLSSDTPWPPSLSVPALTIL